MPDRAKNARHTKLTDLELRIGQTVQLIVHGQPPRKHYTRLIGYVENEFIMLRVPVENGWAVVLDPGQAMDVRVFCGVSLYEFETRLQTLLLHPRNYMLLTCPNRIRQTRLRSHERVKCAMPVQIVQAPSGQPPHAGFQFHDISGAGAALVGPGALGEAGQQIEVAFDFSLSATGTQERVRLQADIQSVQALRNQAGETTGYHHGIHFEQTDPRLLLLVNDLQKPRAD